MNDEQTLNFIDCYQKEEVLWNTKSKLYRNRAARSEAVERILKALNIEGIRHFSCTCFVINIKVLRKI